MFSKHITVQNYNRSLPPNFSDPISLPLMLLANHVFKELASTTDFFSVWLEFMLLMRKFESSRDLTLRKEHLPRFREGKRNMSNLLGRSFGRSLLDRHAGVCVFDEMERYLANSKLNRLFPSSITAALKNRKHKSPDFLAQDANGSFHILESKGRLKGYSEKTLDSFVLQSQNITLSCNGTSLAHKTWAIPIHLSTNIGSSYASIVDPDFEGEDFFDQPEYSPLKHSFSRIFNLIGHHQIASLLERREGVLKTTSEITVETALVVVSGIEKQFVINHISPFRYDKTLRSEEYFFLRRFSNLRDASYLIFGLELRVFRLFVDILRKGDNNFRSVFSSLSERQMTEDDSIGYSSDGTALFNLNAVTKFSKLRL